MDEFYIEIQRKLSVVYGSGVKNTTQSATQSTQLATQTTQSTTQSTQSSVPADEEPAWMIVNLIKEESTISQKQMADKLRLNPNTLKYYIKKMREKGMIERIRTSRKGKWIVK